MREQLGSDDKAWIERVQDPSTARAIEQSALWCEIVAFSARHPGVPVADAIRNIRSPQTE